MATIQTSVLQWQESITSQTVIFLRVQVFHACSASSLFVLKQVMVSYQLHCESCQRALLFVTTDNKRVSKSVSASHFPLMGFPPLWGCCYNQQPEKAEAEFVLLERPLKSPLWFVIVQTQILFSPFCIFFGLFEDIQTLKEHTRFCTSLIWYASVVHRKISQIYCICFKSL